MQEMTRDVFYDGRLELEQPREGMRVSSDALLLAAAIPALPGQRLFEVGSGNGIVSLGVGVRVPDVSGIGIDIQADLCQLACRNAARNGLTALRFVPADASSDFASLMTAGLRPDSFDHAFANPPFYRTGHSRPAPGSGHRRQARQLSENGLDDWLRIMCAFLKQKGSVTLIHPAERLGDILAAMEKRFGHVRILPLHSRAGQPAYRVLVQAIKGSRAELKLLPGLTLQDENGHYFEEIKKMLNGGRLVLEY